jgi:hypothetical protein
MMLPPIAKIHSIMVQIAPPQMRLEASGEGRSMVDAIPLERMQGIQI